LRGYKIPVVVFFSVTLIFSLLSNLPKNVYALQFLWLTEDGLSSSVYGPGQTIRIDTGGIQFTNDCERGSGLPDFVYPSSDVYIIPHPVGGVGAKLTDVSGIPNTVTGISTAGLFTDEIIGFSDSIGPGTYDVVYDECQNTKLDSQDKVFPQAIKIVFPNDLPKLPNAEMKQIKTIAKQEAEIWKKHADNMFFYFIFMNFLSLATGNNIDALILLLQTIAGLYLPDVMLGAQLALINKVKHFNGIAADPPQFNYENMTFLKPINESLEISNDPVITSLSQVISNSAKQNILLEGLLNSIEKYQGAEIENNGEWGLIHAQQIKSFTDFLISETNSSQTFITNLVSSISKDNRPINDFISNLTSIQSNGLSNELIRAFKNQGLSENEINRIYSNISNTQIPISKELFIDSLIQTKKSNDIFVQKFQLFSEAMSNILDDIQQNPSIVREFPISKPGGPYFGQVNIPITFNGLNSSSPSNSFITGYKWDLDNDGLFDDSVDPSPTVTYSQSLEGFIGLKVTNTFGNTNVEYSPVNISDSNNIPVIESFSPNDIVLRSVVDIPQIFTINSKDNDGDPIETFWYIDNENTGIIGNEFVYIPSINQVGIHEITAKVSDSNNGIVNKKWTINVYMTDKDNDHWNSNIDCNDNNQNINPGVQEIPYNGIDDDCNSITFDNNSPPKVQNKIHSVFQNSTNSNILLQGSDIDNDPLEFIVIDKPENGVLGPIITNSPSSALISYTPHINFHGTDKLTFIANDGEANSTIGTVNFNIPILTPPAAKSKTITIDEDMVADIELDATSNDGHQLQFTLLPQTSIDGKKDPGRIGTLTTPQIIDKDSAITRYTPFPNYQSGSIGMGVDRIPFNVVDPPLAPDQRSQSNGQITININPVNDPPSSFGKIVKTIENAPIDIFLRANDVENDFILNDKFNHGIKYSIFAPPTHGTLGTIKENIVGFNKDLNVNITQNWVTYTPSSGFIGEDHFSIIASDGNLTGNTSDISILVTPQSPVVKPNFAKGDLLVNDALRLQWLDPDGTANQKTNLLSGRASIAGGAFDGEGNVYIPQYSGGIVSKYNLTADLIGAFGDRLKDYNCKTIPPTNPVICDFWPTAITFDKSGNGYIGGAVGTLFTGQSRDSLDDIRKFDSNGNLIQKFDVDVLSSGIFGLELGADQCTLYYSSWEGSNTQDQNRDIIKRFDVCENKQLTDFTNIFQDPLYDELRFGHQPIRDFKLLSDGGMIVAQISFIHHLDNSGKIVKTYDIAGVPNWESVALDTDRTSFWAGGANGLYKINIATGEVLQFFDLIPANAFTNGIMVYGEPKPSLTEISPLVIDQNVVVNQNIPFPINLTGFDENNDPLTFSIIEEPIFGTLSSNIDQITNNTSQIRYTPNPDFDGIDSFTFIANDGKLNSTNTGTIMIVRNHAPLANNDESEEINTFQGIPVNITVLDNDSDIDIGNSILDDAISIESINTTETLGNVNLNSNNKTINYVPFAPQYIGSDSFSYTITDKYGLTDTAKVTVNVLSSNNIPIANNQTIETLENITKTIQLIANDADPHDILFYHISDGPSNGFITNFNSTTGLAEYHPLRTFHGEDSFTFTVHDGKDKSLPGIVNITVIDDNINDAPNVESERISANVSQQIAIDVLQNDIDPNGDILTLTNFTGPFNGTAVLNQDQTITYQSDPDFNGSDVLYYRVADQLGSFDIGQLIIDVQGDAVNQIIQVPSDRFVTTTRDQPIDVELVATATIDRPVTFFIIDAPDNGTLGDVTTLSDLSASVNYTPNNGFVGDDSFTYIVIDEKGVVSNIGTIRVSIDDVAGNAPVARDSLVTLDEDTSIPIQLDASDSDVNNDLTYSIELQPVSGKILSFDTSIGSLIYEPNANFNGNDAFLFKAVDQDGLESNIATVRITVNSVNDPPVANNQQLETAQNTSLQITLSGADHIDNGDTVSQFRIVNGPTNGQISNFDSNTGKLTYTPNTSFVGQDSFTFKVTDNHGLDSANTGIVTINVKLSQEPPNNEEPPLPLPSSVCTDSTNDVKPKGTQGNDELIGTSQRDSITGLGGNDRFNGCSGDDTLNGNSGNDGIAGGTDDDKLHGNEGNDYLQGDSGSDSLYGNEGNDILVGNEDRDRFFCGSGHDTILDFDYPLDVKLTDCEEF
jgi:hypothetical protein